MTAPKAVRLRAHQIFCIGLPSGHIIPMQKTSLGCGRCAKLIKSHMKIGIISSMRHEKKIWPDYFQKILDGKKTFELRLADWECHEGDTLVLREWDPATKQYTGRTMEKEVTCVLKTKDVDLFPKEDVEKYGYQIISIK